MNAASAGEGTTDHPIFLTQETQTYAAELSVGQTLILGMDPEETVVIASITPATGAIVLQAPLAFDKGDGDLVIPVRSLTAAVRAGAAFLFLTDGGAFWWLILGQRQPA